MVEAANNSKNSTSNLETPKNGTSITDTKKVENPLTIIAIFAGLAEVAATVTLGLIDKELQSIFIWFVMIFPIILVSSFFVTLNKNAIYLYAPSDFSSEKIFLKAFTIEKLNDQVQDTKELIDKLMQAISGMNKEESFGLLQDAGGEPKGMAEENSFIQKFGKDLITIQEKLDQTKETVELLQTKETAKLLNNLKKLKEKI